MKETHHNKSVNRIRNLLTVITFILICALGVFFFLNVKNKTTSIAKVTDLKVFTCEYDAALQCTRAKVQLKDGSSFDLDYDSQTAFSYGSTMLKNNMEVLVSVDGYGNKTFIGPVRHTAIILLGIIFIIVVLAVTGMQGLRSIISLAISIFLIFFVYVPAIASGMNPITMSLVVVGLTILFSMFFIHGFNRKIIAASLGIVAAISLTAIIASVFLQMANLTGTAEEESIFLFTVSPIKINMQAVLISSVLLATLGLLDDATVMQSGIVFLLKRENPDITLQEMFSKAMAIGRDHITSLVNTLIIAYTASMLPLILLLYTVGADLLDTVNREVVAEEIIRSLVGSIGLILSIPLTTAVAAFMAQKLTKKQLEEETKNEKVHVH